MQQNDVNLQRRVAEQPQNLGFRRDFCRHEVEQRYLQGPDVLLVRARLAHDEYVLFLERFGSWQIVVYLNWHMSSSSKSNLVFVQMQSSGGNSPLLKGPAARRGKRAAKG
jgi:hypothetical protein